MKYRVAGVIVAWLIGGLVAAGCLFTAWLGSLSWGDGADPMTNGETISLVGVAALALAIPLMLWRWLLPRTIRRRTLLLGLTGLTLGLIGVFLLLGLGT